MLKDSLESIWKKIKYQILIFVYLKQIFDQNYLHFGKKMFYFLWRGDGDLTKRDVYLYYSTYFNILTDTILLNLFYLNPLLCEICMSFSVILKGKRCCSDETNSSVELFLFRPWAAVVGITGRVQSRAIICKHITYIHKLSPRPHSYI